MRLRIHSILALFLMGISCVMCVLLLTGAVTLTGGIGEESLHIHFDCSSHGSAHPTQYWTASTHSVVTEILEDEWVELGRPLPDDGTIMIAVERGGTFSSDCVAERWIILEFDCPNSPLDTNRIVIEIDERIIRTGRVEVDCPCVI